MALFDSGLAREVVRQVRRHYLKLGEALGELAAEQLAEEVNEESPLYQDMLLLIDVANGRYHRSEELIQQVEQALTNLMEVLFGNTLHAGVTIPDSFWQTDIGTMVSRVRWWISVDDLITISSAAALAFGANTQANRMRISRAIDKGLLEWVPDPSVMNPQQRKRVLRSQVERLSELRRLPE